MDIIEKVDLPSLQSQQQQFDIEKLNVDFIELPTTRRSVIDFDLTAVPNYCHEMIKNSPNISVHSEQEEPNFTVNNSLDDHQQGDDMMMIDHATTISSSSPIWLPADKHPQISPSEFEHWIKTHSNENNLGVNSTSKTTVRRKRSVLSTVSYNSSEEDGSSSGSSDDDDTTPPTPTTDSAYPTLLIPEPKHRPNNITLVDENKLLLCRQAKHAHQQQGHSDQDGHTLTTTGESRTNSTENVHMHHVETQQVVTQQQPSTIPQQEQTTLPPPTIKIPNMANQPIMDSPEKVVVTNHKHNNRKSWFSGLLHDLKKSTSNNSNKTTKKTGLSGFFSRTLSSSNNQKSAISSTVNITTNSSKISLSSNIKSTNHNSNTIISTITSSNVNNKKSSNKAPQKKVVDSVVKRISINPSRKIQPQQQVPSSPLITRYPLNTERAIYRLSHMKLGNSKRPLQQQVLISNMMYWYLSITERQQQQQLYYQLQHLKNSNSYYYANKRQQVYFNNIYQATYQSFEPPAPGGGGGANNHHYYQQNNPTNNNYHHQHVDYHPYFITPSPPSPPNQSTDIHIATTTTTTKQYANKGNNNKKKYKPVRNTEYEPINSF